MGFLSERELTVTYKGMKSEPKKMPGGSPQGTVLGPVLFLILILNISENVSRGTTAVHSLINGINTFNSTFIILRIVSHNTK